MESIQSFKETGEEDCLLEKPLKERDWNIFSDNIDHAINDLHNLMVSKPVAQIREMEVDKGFESLDKAFGMLFKLYSDLEKKFNNLNDKFTEMEMNSDKTTTTKVRPLTDEVRNSIYV
jgi:archaellum component FlaC